MASSRSQSARNHSRMPLTHQGQQSQHYGHPLATTTSSYNQFNLPKAPKQPLRPRDPNVGMFPASRTQWHDVNKGTPSDMQTRRRPVQDRVLPENSNSNHYRAWQPPVSRSRDPVPPDLRSSEHYLQMAGVMPGAKAVFVEKSTRWFEQTGQTLGSASRPVKLVEGTWGTDTSKQNYNAATVRDEDLATNLPSSMADLALSVSTRPWQGPHSSMPELADTGIADICGAQHKLLKVSDAFRDHLVPYSTIAIAGLAGSGKSHSARLFLARASFRAPLLKVLHVDFCKDGIRLTGNMLDSECVYRTFAEVENILEPLVQKLIGLWLVVVDGVRNQEDCELVKGWHRRFFAINGCVMVTTRRLDIAKKFAGADGGLFTLEDVSSWMATYLLSVPGLEPSSKDLLATMLSRQPVALTGAFRLLQGGSIDSNVLAATLDQLLYDPSCRAPGPVRAAFRAAAEDFYTNRRGAPSTSAAVADEETSRLHAVLMSCITQPWLAMCSRLQRENPLAISMLAILSVSARDVIDPRLLAIIDSVLGQQGGTSCLKDHCIIVEELGDESNGVVKHYRCLKPVYLAVKTWLAREQRLDEAYSLADTIAGLYDRDVQAGYSV